MRRWIIENQPGTGNGWEPYPTARRIVNWIKWGLSGETLDQTSLESLAVQVRWLNQSLEYHLLGNHLFANGKALIFAGLFFSGPEGQNWLRRGEKILATEIDEQILPDGGHFELSPAYHAVIAEDLLDVINLSRVYGHTFPKNLQVTAEAMIGWLRVMSFAKGRIGFFNDSCKNMGPSGAELSSYAGRLDIAEREVRTTGLTLLKPSGYARYESPRLTVLVDVGEVGPDYNPGHAHCDMLSFELAVDGHTTIVNTGVSTYNNNELRHHQRSTRAHNTVQVGGHEQSEIWSSFRVGRRARIRWVETDGHSCVSAAHTGFRRAGVIHRREFRFSRDSLQIMDFLDSSSTPPTATAYLHFHPSIDVSADGQWASAGPLRLVFEGATNIDVQTYEYAPEFNLLFSGKMLVIDFDSTLGTNISL